MNWFKHELRRLKETWHSDVSIEKKRDRAAYKLLQALNTIAEVYNIDEDRLHQQIIPVMEKFTRPSDYRQLTKADSLRAMGINIEGVDPERLK